MKVEVKSNNCVYWPLFHVQCVNTFRFAFMISEYLLWKTSWLQPEFLWFSMEVSTWSFSLRLLCCSTNRCFSQVSKEAMRLTILLSRGNIERALQWRCGCFHTSCLCDKYDWQSWPTGFLHLASVSWGNRTFLSLSLHSCSLFDLLTHSLFLLSGLHVYCSANEWRQPLIYSIKNSKDSLIGRCETQ